MQVHYRVPLIPQSTRGNCWAAAITMILSWRSSQTVPLDDVVHAGRTLPLPPEAGTGRVAADLRAIRLAAGLNDNELGILLGRFGLVAEPPQTYLPDALGGLLQRYGPLL